MIEYTMHRVATVMAAVATVVLALAMISIVGILVFTERNNQYVHLHCANSFSGESFETDRTVVKVSPPYKTNTFELTDNTGRVTYITPDSSLVCTMSRDYPETQSPN